MRSTCFKLSLVGLLALATSCATDDGEDGGSSTSRDASYVLTTQVFTADGASSYLLASVTLDGLGEVSLEDTVEIGGRAIAVGGADVGAVFVAGSEDPSLTRYGVDEEGNFEVGATKLSFANEGVTTLLAYEGQFQFVSKQKAYFFDPNSAQIIIWNPEDMIIVDTIDLTDMRVDGYDMYFGPAPVWRGDELVYPAFYGRNSATEFLDRTGVVFLDTTDDTVRFASDDRCPYVSTAVVADDGTIYAGTSAYAAGIQRVLPDAHGEACMVRIEAGAYEFDADFVMNMSEFTGTTAAGGLYTGANNTAVVMGLDESSFPIDEDTDGFTLGTTQAWDHYLIDLDTLEMGTEVESWPESVGDLLILTVDDRQFVTEYASDFSNTDLREVTGGTAGEIVTNVPGVPFSLAPVR